MARKTIIAAGAFSLLLVGTWVKAQADEPDPAARARTDVVHLLGKTICFSEAPAALHCDWRLRGPGQPERTEEPGLALTLFGTRYCFGTTSDGRCDWRIPPEEKVASKSLRLLGIDVCFGDASPGSHCDLRLPAVPAESEKRARL